MRLLTILLVVLAPIGATSAEETVRAFDGAEVARLAAVYERTAAQGRYETAQEFAESQYFRGFVIGVALTGAKLGFLCPPAAGVNFRALWSSTATWLREHPGEWAQGPEEVVMASLRNAYPCANPTEPVPANAEPAAQTPAESTVAPQPEPEQAVEPEAAPQ